MEKSTGFRASIKAAVERKKGVGQDPFNKKSNKSHCASMNDFLTRLGNGKNHKGLSRRPRKARKPGLELRARVLDCFLGDSGQSNSLFFYISLFVRVGLVVATKLMTGLISCRLVTDQRSSCCVAVASAAAAVHSPRLVNYYRSVTHQKKRRPPCPLVPSTLESPPLSYTILPLNHITCVRRSAG